MKIENKNKLILAVVMVAMAAAMRVVPHWPNFTPIAAMALFGGAYLSDKKLSFAIPFAAMFLSDIILGFHTTMWAVYISFAAIVGIGFLLREKNSVVKTAGAALASSVLFFVVTNFAVWAAGGYYSMDLAGLVQCYTAAIPFFQYNAIGDLFYTGVMFGAFELAKAKVPAFSEA
ncbi:hypothetical protein MASR1M107_22020 [Ignavibacteriales bacterium]